MIIYIIRHGDPDYVQDCLTPKGRRQAMLLAARMAACSLAEIYSSPRGRAKETAMGTAAMTGCPVVVEEALREIEYKVRLTDDGEYHDIRTPVFNEELKQADAALVYGILNPCRDLSGLTYATMAAFLDETRGFLDRLTLKHGFQREGSMYRVRGANKTSIALFCHGNLGLALVAYLLNLPLALVWKTFRMHTTGVTRIDLAGEEGQLQTPVCSYLSDTSHLQEATDV